MPIVPSTGDASGINPLTAEVNPTLLPQGAYAVASDNNVAKTSKGGQSQQVPYPEQVPLQGVFAGKPLGTIGAILIKNIPPLLSLLQRLRGGL
jgi:hypothetical protein